jgi:hypothetical protein
MSSSGADRANLGARHHVGSAPKEGVGQPSRWSLHRWGSDGRSPSGSATALAHAAFAGGMHRPAAVSLERPASVGAGPTIPLAASGGPNGAGNAHRPRSKAGRVTSRETPAHAIVGISARRPTCGRGRGGSSCLGISHCVRVTPATYPESSIAYVGDVTQRLHCDGPGPTWVQRNLNARVINVSHKAIICAATVASGASAPTSRGRMSISVGHVAHGQANLAEAGGAWGLCECELKQERAGDAATHSDCRG